MIELGQTFNLNLSLPTGAKPLSMIWVEAGDFILGNHYKDYVIEEDSDMAMDDLQLPGDTIPTKISNGFWLSQFLITQAQWEVLGNLAIQYRDIWLQDDSNPFWMDDNYPVCGLSWLEAMLFCRELNILYKDELPTGYHFSLPTELQWEYAAKSGGELDNYTLTFEQFQDMYDIDNLKEVGTQVANAWGFYDMIGNIREICYDIAADYADPDWADEHSYPVEEGKILDWVGNKETQYFINVSKPEQERVVRGCHASTHREIKLPSADMLKLVGMRLCLRPIIDWDYCDLDDLWLFTEGINILGD